VVKNEVAVKDSATKFGEIWSQWIASKNPVFKGHRRKSLTNGSIDFPANNSSTKSTGVELEGEWIIRWIHPGVANWWVRSDA